MVVITEISVPADQFPLGRLFTKYPDVTVELERVVPVDGAVLPLIWTSGVDPGDVIDDLRTAPTVREITHLTDVDGRSLFDVRWGGDACDVIEPVVEAEATMLRARGTDTTWTLRLQFADSNQLTRFQERCRHHGLRFHLDALYHPQADDRDSAGTLTEEQYDIIAAAYGNGYWDVPRKITLEELSASVGISSNAASQRLRRGLNSIVEQAVTDE